jgi:hypothetical protein
MTKKSKVLDWYQNELTKDKIELDKEKERFIQKIKQLKKEEIVPKVEKLTLWKRIKKVLMG